MPAGTQCCADLLLQVKCVRAHALARAVARSLTAEGIPRPERAHTLVHTPAASAVRARERVGKMLQAAPRELLARFHGAGPGPGQKHGYMDFSEEGFEVFEGAWTCAHPRASTTPAEYRLSERPTPSLTHLLESAH